MAVPVNGGHGGSIICTASVAGIRSGAGGHTKFWRRGAPVGVNHARGEPAARDSGFRIDG